MESVPPRRSGFVLLLLGLALALVDALAKPRWGYTYEDVKRKGLDLILAVDTSRSMLSNDVASQSPAAGQARDAGS